MPPFLPRRVCILQRIIEAIRIGIVVLRVLLILDVGVGREETAEGRVVETGVHIDEAEGREMLMPCIATTDKQTRLFPRGKRFLCFSVAQTSPSVVTEFL